MRMLVGHDLPLYQEVMADYLVHRFPNATIDRGPYVHLNHLRPDLVIHHAVPSLEQQQRILTWIVLPQPGETMTQIFTRGEMRQIPDLGMEELSALIQAAAVAEDHDAAIDAAIAELLQRDEAVFHPE